MGSFKERQTGPSRLDVRLNLFRDPESGHIRVTAQEAKDILLTTLLAFYRDSFNDGKFRASTKIEALVEIIKRDVMLGGTQTAYNYDDFKENLDMNRQQETETDRARRARVAFGRVILPDSSQAEI